MTQMRVLYLFLGLVMALYLFALVVALYQRLEGWRHVPEFLGQLL